MQVSRKDDLVINSTGFRKHKQLPIRVIHTGRKREFWLRD